MIFADVPPESPNADAIERVSQAGILSGVLKPDGKRYFEPDRAVSRRELAVILDRMNVAELLTGYPLAGSTPPPTTDAAADV